jgi:hypothetical protein
MERTKLDRLKWFPTMERKEFDGLKWFPTMERSKLDGLNQRSLEATTFKSATTGKTRNFSTGNNIMYTLYSGKNMRVMTPAVTTALVFLPFRAVTMVETFTHPATQVIGELVLPAMRMTRGASA